MLEETIIKLLRESLQTVATAESCTGGLLANNITNIAGASDIFQAGWVTYSNESKSNLLAIPCNIIERHGAVSSQVAKLMAEAAQRISGATFGLSTTGIAGPDGGTKEKPVGTIYMALAEYNKETKVWSENFSATRIDFKKKAVEALLQKLQERLLLSTSPH
ncbi:MAG: CinA family protein [Chthoniobacterales bacterium]